MVPIFNEVSVVGTFLRQNEERKSIPRASERVVDNGFDAPKKSAD
jgi:hypothetical protein